MQTIVHRLLMVLASGGILVSFSEFWFYEVGAHVGRLEILLAYGLLGFVFLATLEIFRVDGFSGFFVAACLLGFLIEGVFVPVVYSGPPMTIVWTSMAWHALLSVTVGWLVFRQVMIRGKASQKLLLNLGIGVSLGLWNAYSWNAIEMDGAPDPVFRWRADDSFAMQFLVGYVLFISGHALASLIGRWSSRISKREFFVGWMFAIACSFSVALSSGFILSYALLPILVGICLWTLTHLADRESAPNNSTVTYRLMVLGEMGIEANAILILTAGPVSVWHFVGAVYQASVRATGQSRSI